MLRLLRVIPVIIAVLSLAQGQVTAQQGQTLHIVMGKKVTLRADAEHALSYIWFRNGEPINGQHDTRIIVTEDGVYTVMALGDECNSDLSDPMEVIVQPDGDEVEVDLEIRNLPDQQQAWVDEEFNFQLVVLNNSTVAADDVVATFFLPQSLAYIGSNPDITFDAAKGVLTWIIARIEAGESMSEALLVKGELSGEAITIARVSSRQQDSKPSDNEAQAAVEIVALFVPNVFTPNNDGKNDTFAIKGLETFKTKKLYVFNRFGNEVYRSDDYQNDWAGEGLNEATYFYFLELTDWTGKVHRQRGYVLLARRIFAD